MISIVIISIILKSCVTRKEVYNEYSKGGHPAGKSELKKNI
jgi:hypothetical protein